MNPLLELTHYGQSYWIDDLTRGMIKGGELHRRVRDEGLTGVTTNPAIFRAALDGGDDYDRQIVELAGRPLHSLYEALIVTDVRDACDVLLPVYERTEGLDGFVSLEVSPNLARNTHGSIIEARRLWHAVSRPNLLIKIPGTFEGLAAVETLLFEGINVNVTLLFSVARYDEVALAHMSALERRKAQGATLANVASVASFFLSRIDVHIDALLQAQIDEGRDLRDLLGQCAVANAKLAYRRFLELHESGRWRFVARAGAHPQRLLWASTSTKNKGYDDLKYVEPLIGAHTINTLPPQTIAAFADHGRASASIEEGMAEAGRVMSRLQATGVDVSQATRQLLDEGVQKFIDAYNGILQTLATKTTHAH